MNEYEITYKTSNGFEDTVIVSAANKVMAYEVFESLGFEDVVEANAALITE